MKIRRIPVPYGDGECSDLCYSCLYNAVPSCYFWHDIEGFGDYEGNPIVIACSSFKKRTLGSRLVFQKGMRDYERIYKCKKEVDK